MAISLSEWVDILQGADTARRIEALEGDLPEGDETEMGEALVKVLSDPDAQVRALVAEHLANFPTDSVRAALRTAAESETDEAAKAQVLSSLGYVGELADVTLLAAAALKENTPEQTIHVAVGLAEAARRHAIDMLCEALRSDNVDTRALAADALCELVEPPASPVLFDALEERIEKETDEETLARIDALVTFLDVNDEDDSDDR